MLTDDEGLTLKELVEQSGVPERTVRYYMQQGLLPPAPRSGPGVRYPASCLQRLLLVRGWQDELLPLEQIRKMLADLSDVEIERVARARETPPAPVGRVADYVKQVLGKRAATPPPWSGESAATPSTKRSQWERFVLDADVELHVRRPLSHAMNRRVEALLAEAKKILASGPSTGTRDDKEKPR